ncbi:MAG: HEAT repeat domain-containing protein [Anaerolineales bacterium]|nr:HEAT repeat domain-containing protein [Anaerolineales bacterium]
MSDMTVEQALAVAQDTKRSSQDREAAMRSLENKSSDATITAMIKLLSDSDAGVRWTAASTLISFGDTALVPLLQALVEQHDSTWLREGAYHVFHDTKSIKVSNATMGVMKALKGPASETATTDAAAQALMKIYNI